jgi:uncharacterized membrane protein
MNIFLDEEVGELGYLILAFMFAVSVYFLVFDNPYITIFIIFLIMVGKSLYDNRKNKRIIRDTERVCE